MREDKAKSFRSSSREGELGMMELIVRGETFREFIERERSFRSRQTPLG